MKRIEEGDIGIQRNRGSKGHESFLNLLLPTSIETGVATVLCRGRIYTSVLLNWDDEDCIKKLKNAKEAISSKVNEGKVIIIDFVLDEKHDENEMLEAKLLLNIFFSAKHNSKLRSEQEWKQLSLKAGFKGYKMFPMFGLRSRIMLHKRYAWNL
ncbi:hypothetical protein K1719_026445 [Acacia pycnantha]|nr:hypothetical protein K1719_026445 [Acacia pycnantha]